jgi:ADP-ribose pyrophosphatase YjhB (NUDIX family)
VSFAANASCFDYLKQHLPPLPAIKDVDLYKPMVSIEGIRDSVVAAIVHDGKMLMLQRGGEIGRGTWGLVGGKLDQGESLVQTLEWETWEEVGLESLSEFSLVDVHYHVVPEQEKVFRVFVIKAKYDPTEIPDIKEHDKILGMGCFSLDDLPQPLFANFKDYKDLLNETSDGTD